MFSISRQSKELQITPKNLKVAKTPEEHKLLSKLSKVKSLWEGSNTPGSPSICPNPGTLEELDPTGDVNLEEKSSVAHSVSDTKLPEKREAWVAGTEKENGKDDTEVVRMNQDEQDEYAGEARNNTASLPEDNSVVSSETVNKEERSSSSGPGPSDEKLEDQSGKSDQEHLQKSKQPPSDAKASMASEEVPRKKLTRRGGRGRKPKSPGRRHNENVNRTPEKQEKATAGNAAKGKNTPARSHHHKGYDDFKGDVPNADRTPEKQEKATADNATESKNPPTRSHHQKGYDDFKGDAPKASPKKPRVERSEERQGDAQSAHGGAESTPRQLTRNVEASEKGGGEKGAPDANKQDHVKNTRTGNPAYSPGDSSRGGASNRGRRRPRSRTSKRVPGDEKQDTRNRSDSTPEKRQPKNS